ncbi:Proteophosphoglycan ppg4 [Rhodotorula toruloides ATCC 204091]|uniref:Proteophosphoglycan ppg4 n=1 Tax=Rhodotorula toruloides TaxID=5286 RepID=A0A0K3CEW9_RHOTO|nr:Proteophosphoglycan ppg4 [Rhodotorula toruloides ATCC 204091]KAK4332619.1 Proteophosphoglycan ppg4 [Rhodotorula toruloides]PRQ74098.1 Proteophosphoglycan ppg4 [Rhodotorula toruloides]
MHAFFDPAFTVLHDRVLDFLVGGWDWYRLLAAMGVNQHFRRLARDKLVKHFSQKPKLYLRPGVGDPDEVELEARIPIGAGFVRLQQCECPHSDFGPSCPVNDPRSLFAIDMKELDRLAMADMGETLDEDEGMFDKPERMDFYMTSFDPKTNMCTFKPGGGSPVLLYHLYCDPLSGEEWGCCDAWPAVFQLASTAWFMPALDGKNSHAGLKLAARPDLQPARQPAMWPKASQEKGGRKEQHKYRCENGWIADLTTQRLDKPDKPNPDDKRAFFAKDYDPEAPPCLLMVDSLRLPLIDLLIPPLTAKDDVDPLHYEEFPVEEYIKEYYEEGKEWAMERTLAEMHDAAGCVY